MVALETEDIGGQVFRIITITVSRHVTGHLGLASFSETAGEGINIKTRLAPASFPITRVWRMMS